MKQHLLWAAAVLLWDVLLPLAVTWVYTLRFP